jgi:ferric-dicitrate binding protein FerR (iron transport regulator)
MNDDLLIQRYLDGRLSRDELAQLNDRLLGDADLRRHLREIAEQAVAFGDLARQCEKDTPVCSPTENPDRGVWSTMLALAACVALLLASVWFFTTSKPAPILTLIESTGTITWNHGEPIVNGEMLPGGTVETVGEASSAQFRFADGTLITLQGEAEMSFSEEEQKVLILSRGTLSAEVKPQPAGRPMLVRTPSAEVEVVGTAFDLSARTEDTLLKVNEGLVKLMRLADGSEIEVAANRSAVASLNTDSRLDASSTPEPLTDWGFDFTTQTPPRDWRGYAAEGRMNATAYAAKRLPEGRIITHYGISVRPAMLSQPLRLLATADSVIHYRLRMERPGPLQLMLLTNRPEGGFGGNFECGIRAEELQPGPDGWCEVAIPLGRFRPLDPHHRHPSPAGKILTSVLLSSYRENRELSVSHFELTARP